MFGGDSDMVMENKFSVWPRQCSIKGGVRLNVSLPNPPLDTSSLHLVFSADTTDTTDTANATADTTDTSGDVVDVVRDGEHLNVYHATAPARNTPGQTQLSLHCTDSSGHQTILYTALFTYTLHDYQDLTERILQHAKDGLPLQSDLIPLLENPEDLVELDRSLTAVVCGLEQPLDWRASRDGEHGHVTAGRAEVPQTTLLHVASRHNLMSLAKHLMTLPKVNLALCLPDEQGLTPVDIARHTGNVEMLKVLTCAVLKSSLTGCDLLTSEGSIHSSKRNQDELLRFREINEEWRGQIKRQKISSSMGSTDFNPEITTANPRDRLPTPPFPQISPSTKSPASRERRKSIAVMEAGQRHANALECLQLNVKVPELAVMDRHRKQSWSVVVGGTDSRSVDTGLNELDRVIAADGVQQCMSAMQGDLEASQEGQEEGGGSGQLDPARLNLLYCYSVSCPLLTEDDESGTGTNSLLMSTRTSPGPDIGSDTESPPHRLQTPSLPTSISVPEDLSDTGLHVQRTARHPNAHPVLSSSDNPLPALCVRVPQVITTRYSTEHLEVVSQSRGGPTDEECSGGEQDSPTEKTVLRNVSCSTVNQDEEEEGEEEEEDLCQSVSAPHLRGDSEEEDGVDEQEEEVGDGSERRQHDSIDKKLTGPRKTKREVAFGKSHAVLENKNSSDVSSGNLSRVLSVQADTPHTNHGRKKSHRRSQSMSVVELGIPPTEKKFLPDKCDEEDKGDDKTMRRNIGSVTLKPGLPSNQSLDQHSNASASRSNSMKGGDNRSRASSLFTDASSMHESGESSDDDTMPELSGVSCASLEGVDAPDEPSTATPIVNEKEQHRLKLPNDTADEQVVFRGRKGQPHVSQEYRYSADVTSAYKDELETNPALADAGVRRLNSECIGERKEVVIQRCKDGNVDSEKTRLINDSVFDQEVTLSDVDVRLPSDDNLSQNYEGLSQDKTSPCLSPPSKVPKKRAYSRKRSPLVNHKPPTVKEKTPPKSKSPRNKLRRGLTKDDVSPLIGKMRSILNSHEVSDEDETLTSSSTIQLHNSSAQSEEQLGTADASPNGGSTSLDRVPRSPLSTTKSNHTTTTSTKHSVSPLSYQQHQTSSTASPPLSPPSPGQRHHDHRSTSPCTNTAENKNKGLTSKPNSDKAVSGMPHRKSKRKTMSLDGSASSVKEIMNVRNMVVEPLHEENTEEEEELVDQKAEVAGKKEVKRGNIIRDNLFRRSKSRMKAMTILGGGPDVEKAVTESYTKSSGGTGAVRAKNAKQRPKLDSIFFPNSSKSSQQPVEHTSEEGSEETATTKRKSSPVKLSSEHRHDSDGSLVVSPTNTTFDHSLSAVDELSQVPPLPPTSADQNRLSPAPVENTSDSDHEEVSQQLVRSMSESHPELEIREDRNWERTMDRRLLRKMNKHERDRQNIIHELIQTERHHYRALHVLKLVFKEQMSKYLSEESLAMMFPELDNLIDISKSFLDRLEERRGEEGVNGIIQDVSDILLEEFTTGNRERILNAFGEFCTHQLIATEMYKEQLKKKQFGRLVQQLYRVKECQRLYLPDYYTSVSQRLTKMVQFMVRLVKKTDILKLDHADRLRQCQRELEALVTAVDRHVDDRKNRLELEGIQDKLDIILPRSSTKDSLRRAMKDLNLTAQSRRLIKRGDAQLIHGHGKQLPVHIVLVTDLVVLLTERDQKYNLPALLDLKPPVIRLYDLHVRVNASVRSGVQLLLLEKGSAPEMFRLEFKNKKEAKAWEVTLTNAVDECKEKGIKCEFFGSKPVVVEEEKGGEGESRAGSVSRVRRSSSQRSSGDTTSQNPTVRRIHSARSTLEAASRVLSMFVMSSTTATDISTSPRHPQAAAAAMGYRYNQSPRNRHTVHQTGESGTTAGDRESLMSVSIEIDGGSKKTQKSKIKRKGLDRSSTFRGRGEDKKEKERGAVTESVDSAAHQQLLFCAQRMKDTLEELLKDYEEKTVEIERLKLELEQTRQVSVEATPTIVVARKPSPHSSPTQFRPHSCHISDLSSSLSQPAWTGEDTTGLAPVSLTQEPHHPCDTGT